MEERNEDAERRSLSCLHSHDVVHKYYQESHVVAAQLRMDLDMAGDLKKLLCKPSDFSLSSTLMPHQLFFKGKFKIFTYQEVLSDSALTLKKILICELFFSLYFHRKCRVLKESFLLKGQKKSSGT